MKTKKSKQSKQNCDKSVRVRMPISTVNQLDALKPKTKQTRSAMIREAVKVYLHRQGKRSAL